MAKAATLRAWRVRRREAGRQGGCDVQGPLAGQQYVHVPAGARHGLLQRLHIGLQGRHAAFSHGMHVPHACACDNGKLDPRGLRALGRRAFV